MPSTREQLKLVLEKLNQTPLDITSRPMMGEYLLYADGVLFGGLYDNRLLIKKTETNAEFGLPEALPYEGAKIAWQIEDLGNTAKLTEIIEATLKSLKKA